MVRAFDVKSYVFWANDARKKDRKGAAPVVLSSTPNPHLLLPLEKKRMLGGPLFVPWHCYSDPPSTPHPLHLLLLKKKRMLGSPFCVPWHCYNDHPSTPNPLLLLHIEEKEEVGWGGENSRSLFSSSE